LIVFFILTSCATDYKRGPDGGLNDKISPAIESASIQNGSLNMDRNSSVEIEFSEFIDINSAKNAVSISPRSASKKAKLYWYDKSCVIKFNGLDTDQTVVISVNPSLKDTQGNPMSDPFALSFSTGSNIDRNYISGKISGAINLDWIDQLSSTRVRINLYTSDADSTDLSKMEPEYSTGISKEGNFGFNNVSSGNYRLIAFNDVNNDSKPQHGTELTGITTDITSLSGKDSINVQLTLGNYDNVLPYIKNTSAVSKDVLKIEFSEELKTGINYIDSCYVNSKEVTFREFISPEMNNVYLLIPDMVKDDEIRLITASVKDKSGNYINRSLMTKKYLVTDSVKSRSFSLTGRLPDKIASDKTLVISSSSFMNDFLKFQIRDKDSIVYAIDKGIENIPYTVKIDLAENGIKPGSYDLLISGSDSLFISSKLKIEDAEGSGSVSGTIKGKESEKYILICRNFKGGSDKFSITSKNYKIGLLPGKYKIALFADDNGDDVFSVDLKNYRTEKAVFLADTVFVRKNWETTDVNFDFK
jgi:uncharacterized protein (DUF2141 family)